MAEESSDSISSDNSSVYTESTSSDEDFQNEEEPGTFISLAKKRKPRRQGEIEFILETVCACHGPSKLRTI